MPCPECGIQRIKGARFCHQCGWDSKLAAAGKASSTVAHRPAWKRWTMSVCLAVGSLFVLGLLVVPRSSGAQTLVVGQPAPDFTIESLDGGMVRLSELKGKPVVINFWATYCQPCRKEMPDLQAVYDKYKANGLQVYGINVGESKVAVKDFREQVKARFPILIDAKEEAQSEYKILPIPATFFVDASGTIRAIYQYQMSPAQLEGEVVRLMGTAQN